MITLPRAPSGSWRAPNTQHISHFSCQSGTLNPSLRKPAGAAGVLMALLLELLYDLKPKGPKEKKKKSGSGSQKHLGLLHSTFWGFVGNLFGGLSLH